MQVPCASRRWPCQAALQDRARSRRRLAGHSPAGEDAARACAISAAPPANSMARLCIGPGATLSVNPISKATLSPIPVADKRRSPRSDHGCQRIITAATFEERGPSQKSWRQARERMAANGLALPDAQRKHRFRAGYPAKILKFRQDRRLSCWCEGGVGTQRDRGGRERSRVRCPRVEDERTQIRIINNRPREHLGDAKPRRP